MRRKLPKYVRTKVAKGRVYLYFDIGQRNDAGKPILKKLPSIDDPSFGRSLANYRTMREKRQDVPHSLTVTGLANLFEKSQEFKQLAEASRTVYTLYLKQIREKLGIAPADELSSKEVRIVRDKMADTPGAANMLIRTLGALYNWGRKSQHVTTTPTKDVAMFDQGEHEPWPDWLLERALADPAVRLPVAMLYYTAQRIGDVCKLRWTDIRGGAIELTQHKTGIDLAVPIHSELKKLLDDTPKGGFQILMREDGTPWRPNLLRKALQVWAKGEGAKVVPHGLRKNAVIALLEAGCSVAETAAISGQTLQVIEHYAKRRNRKTLGASAILKWEGNRP